jgi:hypothetical protein
MLDAAPARLHGDEYTVPAEWLTVRFTSEARHRRRYGELAPAMPGRESWMAALVLHTQGRQHAGSAFTACDAVIEFIG